MLLLAVLPSVLLAAYVCRKDKIEKEPPLMLCGLFLTGALTVISAIFLGLIGEAFFEDIVEPDSMEWLLIDNFLLTALVEEGGKYYVLKKRTWDSPHFNYIFDAVVYAVIVSLGFATAENILYVAGSGDLETAVMRGIFSVPGHMIDGVFMGAAYGMAKRCDLAGERRRCKKYLRRALWVPALVHGFYDFCLSAGDDAFIIAFFAFEIVVTLWALRTVRKMSREDAPVS
ncbi:MAG: PrsW family intramembrane metalloprotease [Oscillibacter sp.]|nr:PrsW family intramembrane metalloprotease [Oscillibacter sp.]